MEMASPSAETEYKNVFFFKMRDFPPVVNGRINIVKFLEASKSLVELVDCLGTVFAPVKYDMQGNIDKIQNNYKYDGNSCLLELMLEEVGKGECTVVEGILWLNRAVLFFELTFLGMLDKIRTNDYNVSMKKIFTAAYEGSVKKYHNWVTQQLFSFICKMSPSLLQLLKILELREEHKMEDIEKKLENLNITCHLVRSKIDDFFNDHNLIDRFKI